MKTEMHGGYDGEVLMDVTDLLCGESVAIHSEDGVIEMEMRYDKGSYRLFAYITPKGQDRGDVKPVRVFGGMEE